MDSSDSDEEISDQEIPVASPEIRQAVEEVQRSESVNVIEEVERCHKSSIGSGVNVSDSKNEGEPHMQSCGSQGNKEGNWDPFFFSSTDKEVGPKKRKPVLRPRSKSNVHQRKSSPSSSERPKKRVRDNDPKY
ncbi:hypothetical protein Hanom_Chr09g00776011 [Helianthus anomalus]